MWPIFYQFDLSAVISVIRIWAQFTLSTLQGLSNASFKFRSLIILDHFCTILFYIRFICWYIRYFKNATQCNQRMCKWHCGNSGLSCHLTDVPFLFLWRDFKPTFRWGSLSGNVDFLPKRYVFVKNCFRSLSPHFDGGSSRLLDRRWLASFDRQRSPRSSQRPLSAGPNARNGKLKN